MARLPGLDELLAGAHVVSLPMRVKFRGILQREALLLRGPLGWGEFCPFPEYDDAEASRWLAAAIEAGWAGFPGAAAGQHPGQRHCPCRAGATRCPRSWPALAGWTPSKSRSRNAARASTTTPPGWRPSGRRCPDAAIRVDANGGWDVPDAVTALRRLAAVGLEYAEQPVPEIAGLAEVRRQLRAAGVPVLIAADESVRKEDDPLKVARAGAADLIVVKVAPLGGVRRALQIVAQAGLPAVVSSALDTSVGIRAGLALAAALPELPYACGLGTVSLLAADVTQDSLVPDDGAIALRDVRPAPELLDAHAASPERRDWWLDRLRRVHAVLAASLLVTALQGPENGVYGATDGSAGTGPVHRDFIWETPLGSQRLEGWARPQLTPMEGLSMSVSSGRTFSLLPMLGHTKGKRSPVTCALKCDNACSGEVCNTSTNSYFRDIASATMSRRAALGFGAAGALAVAFGNAVTSAGAAVADGGPGLAAAAKDGFGKSKLQFTAIAPVDAAVDAVTVPAGLHLAAGHPLGRPALQRLPGLRPRPPDRRRAGPPVRLQQRLHGHPADRWLQGPPGRALRQPRIHQRDHHAAGRIRRRRGPRDRPRQPTASPWSSWSARTRTSRGATSRAPG